ncbi:hypothetical protein MKW94_025747 [Papaver nudicaule]|uniref:Peptidase metallopeptidase domain-containing protein n=1 Tax=Papaver nudicaule TaxID=74823 RepID=A0AA41S378_PAPNU|nr:hypothetical protein [Papaver nudicaule]
MANHRTSFPSLLVLNLILLVLFMLAIFPHPTLSQTDSTLPFGFLKKLEGCHKGETVKGLREAKQYLKKFGYLNVESRHENDDEFDDVLESAIKTYQLNYNLETNGILDTPTVKQMMMPRCGVPDIAKDGTTSMKSGMKHQHHVHEKHGSLHIVSHYSFLGTKWPPEKMELVYQFRNLSAANVNLATLESACKRALSSWAAVSKFRFRAQASVRERADIMMGFFRLSHGDGNPFDGPLGVLGHASGPPGGQAHLDADENWSTNPDQSMIDVETMCLHELGHVLELDHSSDTNAVMFSGIASGQRKRTPTADDVNGIRALYS